MTDSVRSLFDHVDEIYMGKRKDYFALLSDEEKKLYNKYMINRILSMNIHQLPVVNAAQQYTIPNEQHYLFFRSIIPCGKQWNPYLKKQTTIADKYDAWLIDLVALHYEVSRANAIEYLVIYYDRDRTGLRELCEKYGIDNKTIKKAKL
jgi:hypothetical protein